MLDPSDIPDVTHDETLTRYLISKKHIRSDSQTVKPDAFIPHPYNELSVTRLIDLCEGEIWSLGEDVAAARDPARTLHGRADILASVILRENLQVQAVPVSSNPNHADVTGWPMNDKPAQKLIAQEIAAAATFVPVS